MRSARLVVVAVLAVLLAASMFNSAAAQGNMIAVAKITTNDDSTTPFSFTVTGNGLNLAFDLFGGGSELITGLSDLSYTVQEIVPSGWVVRDISCVVAEGVGTIQVDFAHANVVISFPGLGTVVCTFTNDPAGAPVGGVVMPVNTFAVLAPWVAVIGLVGCIGTITVVAKPWKKPEN